MSTVEGRLQQILRKRGTENVQSKTSELYLTTSNHGGQQIY